MTRTKKQYRTFEEAKAFVMALGLRNSTQWHLYTRGYFNKDLTPLPDDIPAHPQSVYNKHENWKGMKDFLGVYDLNAVKKEYSQLTAQLPSSLAHAAGGWEPLPEIPDPNPAKVKRKYGERKIRIPLPFEKALRYVRALKLTSSVDWIGFCRAGKTLPSGRIIRRAKYVPTSLRKTYEVNWISWEHFLGLPEKPKKVYTPPPPKPIKPPKVKEAPFVPVKTKDTVKEKTIEEKYIFKQAHLTREQRESNIKDFLKPRY